jgi:putative toxin-antitoxin system antitoxin component (TIGR02293 family)
MTTAAVAQPIREANEERVSSPRAIEGQREGSSRHGHNSLHTVLEVEPGIPKAEAARLFAKIAAVAERPAGRLRAELIPDSSWKRSGERLGPTASNRVARLKRVLAIGSDIWQNENHAIQWILGRHRLLDWATPFSLLRTEAD